MNRLTDAKVNLFHIAYNEATRDALPPGFLLLDNLGHERDDWREYWPIRKFLLEGFSTNSLDNDAWYGFFSPRFKEKTGLTAEFVTQFVRTSAHDIDVATFSPQPDMGAFFLSPFEQEDVFQPGFMAASKAFLAAIGRPIDLASLVMDSRQIVFSNYFVARPAFWRRWLEVNEKLFAVCEGLAGGLHQTLRSTLTEPTAYPGAVQRKVFLMERIVSLLLAVEPQWRVGAYNTFACGWSATALNQFKEEAVISDALKIAMREQGFPQYFAAFSKLREKIG